MEKSNKSNNWTFGEIRSCANSGTGNHITVLGFSIVNIFHKRRECVEVIRSAMLLGCLRREPFLNFFFGGGVKDLKFANKTGKRA